MALTTQDRLLILAPHPDDEILGCAGIIQNAVAMTLPIRIVFLTYGDNNQWSFTVYRGHPILMPKAMQGMGLVRHDEAVAASQLLGLSPDHLIFLGYPDFGTLPIWKSHWGDRPPFRSMLTRVTAVPYANALRPGADYKGEDVLRDVTAVLREFRPTKVFVSHPADHMPDHAALYLFTRVALWDLEPEMTPALYPYLIHFKRWPQPRGFRPAEPLEPPVPMRGGIAWHANLLRPEELERKRKAIIAHQTQYESSAAYLLSFIRPNELFGDFLPVSLAGNVPVVSLAPGSRDEEAEIPEELTDVERAAFVGVEWRYVQRDRDQLVISLEFSRPLAPAVAVSVYVFGYRPDQPFGHMPKIHIQVNALTSTVYDQDRKLPQGRVQITRTTKEITLRVPLELLGDPQRVLMSAKSYFGEVPLDWAPWRVLELSRK